jgi:hypothetical protein
LHPNPAFVVVVCRGLLVKLEFLGHCLSVEVLEVLEILGLALVLFDVLDFSNQVVALDLFV